MTKKKAKKKTSPKATKKAVKKPRKSKTQVMLEVHTEVLRDHRKTMNRLHTRLEDVAAAITRKNADGANMKEQLNARDKASEHLRRAVEDFGVRLDDMDRKIASLTSNVNTTLNRTEDARSQCEQLRTSLSEIGTMRNAITDLRQVVGRIIGDTEKQPKREQQTITLTY